jgi:hypothetical protein
MSNEIARLQQLRAITPPPELDPEHWAQVAVDTFFPEDAAELPGAIVESGLAVLEAVDLGQLREHIGQATEEEPGYSVWRSLKQTRRLLTVGRDTLLVASELKPRNIPELRSLTRNLGQLNDLHYESGNVHEPAEASLDALSSLVLPRLVVPVSSVDLRARTKKDIKIETLMGDVDLENIETYHQARKRFRRVVHTAGLSMLSLELTDERARLLGEGQLLSKRFGQKHGQAVRDAKNLGLS